MAIQNLLLRIYFHLNKYTLYKMILTSIYGGPVSLFTGIPMGW